MGRIQTHARKWWSTTYTKNFISIRMVFIQYLYNIFTISYISRYFQQNDSRTMTFQIGNSNTGLWLIHKKTSNSGNNWTLLRIITKEEDRGATEFPKAICKLLFRGQSKVISRSPSNPRWSRGHSSCHIELYEMVFFISLGILYSVLLSQ